MLNINDQKNWKKIDENTEVSFWKEYKFVRPISSKTISLDCPCCKKLLNNVEDIDSVKENDVCQTCYLDFYFINKEKWEKGWRPYK